MRFLCIKFLTHQACKLLCQIQHPGHAMTFASLGKAVLEKMRLPPHIPVQFVDRDGVNKISNRLDVGSELDLEVKWGVAQASPFPVFNGHTACDSSKIVLDVHGKQYAMALRQQWRCMGPQRSYLTNGTLGSSHFGMEAGHV